MTTPKAVPSLHVMSVRALACEDGANLRPQDQDSHRERDQFEDHVQIEHDWNMDVVHVIGVQDHEDPDCRHCSETGKGAATSRVAHERDESGSHRQDGHDAVGDDRTLGQCLGHADASGTGEQHVREAHQGQGEHEHRPAGSVIPFGQSN